MTQIDHYVSILQAQHHYIVCASLVPRPSSAPEKYEQGGLDGGTLCASMLDWQAGLFSYISESCLLSEPE